MKRKRVIAFLSALVTAPFLTFSQATGKFSRRKRGLKIPSGEGRIHGHIKLKGVNENILDVKISGTETDGDLAIFEQTSLSQGKGTPLPIHHAQNEIFYVLAGSDRFQVGEEKFDLNAGDSIFCPDKLLMRRLSC